MYYGASTRELPELKKGIVVKVRDGKDWRPAAVMSKAKQPRTYFVRLESGQVWGRNQHHLFTANWEDQVKLFQEKKISVRAGIKVCHQKIHMISRRAVVKICHQNIQAYCCLVM